jgi:hypothetical protein
MKFEKIIKNKYLYYAACVLAAINLLGYVSQGSMECIIVFGIATYAAHYLTKNRAIDIFAGLFVSNVLFGCGRIKEGFHTAAQKAAEACALLTEQGHCDAHTANKCRWEANKCMHDPSASEAEKANASARADAAEETATMSAEAAEQAKVTEKVAKEAEKKK